MTDLHPDEFHRIPHTLPILRDQPIRFPAAEAKWGRVLYFPIAPGVNCRFEPAYEVDLQGKFRLTSVGVVPLDHEALAGMQGFTDEELARLKACWDSINRRHPGHFEVDR